MSSCVVNCKSTTPMSGCFMDCVVFESLAGEDRDTYSICVERLFRDADVPLSGDADFDSFIEESGTMLSGKDLKSYFPGHFPIRVVKRMGLIAHFLPGTDSGHVVADLHDDWIFGDDWLDCVGGGSDAFESCTETIVSVPQQRCYYDCIAVEFLEEDSKAVHAVCLSALKESVVTRSTGDSELDFVVDSANAFMSGALLKSFFPSHFPVRRIESVGIISHFVPGTCSGSTVGHLQDDHLYGCSVFSAEFDTRVREIRERTLVDSTSGVSQLINCHFEREVRALLAENNNLIKVPVPQKLSDEDMRILRDHFPRYELRFTQNVDGPHNMAAAHRLLETHDLLSGFPSDVPILDIGGNWYSHFRYGRSNVHSCCPLLDLRDNERQTHRLTMCETLMSGLRRRFATTIDDDANPTRGERNSMREFAVRWAVDPRDLTRAYKRIQDGSTELFCHHVFGEEFIPESSWDKSDYCALSEVHKPACGFKAKYAIMVHSGYDLPVQNLICGMVQHEVIELRGTMIADPAMLVADAGYIPALKCHWHKTKSEIWFAFRDDCTMGYKHDWNNYSKYLTSTVINFGSNYFVMERDKYRHGVLTYSVTKCSGLLKQGTHSLFHNAWFQEMYDKYIMKVPHVKVKDLTGAPGSVECSWRSVVTSRKLIDRVIEVCLRGVKPVCFNKLDETIHIENLKIIQNHLLSHSQTLVLNGATIIREEAIPFKDFSPMSVTIYFEILLTRYKESMSLAWFQSGFDANFKAASWWSSFKAVFWKILGFPVWALQQVLQTLFPHKVKDELEFIKPAVEKMTVLENVFLKDSIMSTSPTLKDYDDSVFFDILEAIGSKESEERSETERPSLNNLDMVVSEAITYCEIEVDRIKKKCDRILKAYLATGNCGGYLNDAENVGLYDKDKNSWAQRPVEFSHEMGWNGEEFTVCDWIGRVPNFKGRYLVVSDSTAVMTNLKLGRKYNHHRGTTIPKVSLVDGVTGCGKTTEIIKRAKPGILILSVCKANVLEMRKKLPTFDVKDIRTVDSFLLKPHTKYEECFIDEYGLAHPGFLLLAMHLSGAKSVTLFGDSEQIPFCNRVADFKLNFENIDSCDFPYEREIRSVTYRCPQDVTLILQKLYKRKPIRTVSTVEKSITIKSIRSECDIPLPNSFEGSVLYICMTKHDESLLKLRWAKENVSSEVRTVHAAQGLSYPNVVYFRLTRTDNDLFTSKRTAYHLVAISRHSKCLVYCTTKPEDTSDFSLSSLQGSFKVSKELTQEASKSEASFNVVFPETKSVSVTEVGETSAPVKEAAAINYPTSSEALYSAAIPEYGVVPEPKGKATHNPSSIIAAIEELTPGNTSIDTGALDEAVELGPMSLEVGKLRWDMSKISPRLFANNKFAVPHLPTGALLRRNTSSRQVGLAIEKRNANVLNSQKHFDLEKVALDAVDKFFELFVDKEKFSQLPSGKLGSTEQQIQLYQNKTGNKVNDPVSLALTPLQKYHHMIKRDVKFALTDAAQSEYTKAATITYHKPEITQIATAIFGQFKTRLLACKKKFLNIPLDHDNDLSGYLSTYHLGSENNTFTEIDFSKFDKSQGELHQLIQDYILIRFGCDPEFVALWSTAHRSSSIYDQNVGIQFKTDFQRRTGDAFTFMGNSLVTAAMLAYVISKEDEKKIRYILIGGDDSLICSYGPISVPLEPLSDIFNMSCKLIQPACPYFASRYLIRRGSEILCVPDPYKLLVKMGRKDIPDNKTSLEEIRTGLADSAKYLKDDEVKEKLSILVQARYNKAAPSLYSALCTIHWALSNNKNFLSLYDVSETSNEVRRNKRYTRIT
nr:polyprotein [Black mulberry idaeovirus]